MVWDEKSATRSAEFRGRLHDQWNELTEDDLRFIDSRQRLITILQEKYGLAPDELEQQIRDFERRLAMSSN